MSITKKAGASALAAALVLGVPGVADAGSSRVNSKLRAAERALDRAQERADDGNADGTVSALASVRRNLAAAHRAALKKVSAESGPDVLGEVAEADDAVVGGAVSILDGQSGAVVSAAVTTLGAALDQRDAAVAAMAAADDDGAYDDVLAQVVEQATGEASDVADALSDDELTDEAKAGLAAAQTQLSATAKVAQAAADLSSAGDAEGVGEDDVAGSYDQSDRGDCPRGGDRGGRRGERPQPGSDAGATYDQAGRY